MSCLSRIAACLSTLRTKNFARLTVAAAVGGAALLATGCGMEPVTGAAHTLSLQGAVHGGQQPVTGSRLQLYAVGTTGDASAATPLISVTLTSSDGTGSPTGGNPGNQNNTLPAGAFTITGAYTCPSAVSQVYLVATNGNPGLAPGSNNPSLAMMAALGQCGELTSVTNVFIDELTTVGSIAPLVPYMNSYSTLGSGSADLAQFLAAIAYVRQYTDTTHGTVPGPDLAPGFYASSVEIQTLGNILAACVNSAGGALCTQLFTLTTPPGGTAPTDTIGAAINIIRYPTNNTAAIFALMPPNSPFQPALTSAPANWSLPILPIVATPIISPASGSYSSAPTVTITSATPGVTIYYTTDGTAPTTSSPMYSGGFVPTGSVTVKAIATAAGYASSMIASAQYTLPASGIGTQLVFLSQPASPAVNQTINGLRVGIADAYGNLVATSGATLTAALANNPTGATLNGTKTATTSKDGTITFGLLSIATPGSGYSITVSSPGLVSATSNSFNVYVSALTINQPLQTIGIGAVTYGNVSLASAAPAGGVLVSLTITDTTIVTVSPATVLIPAGQTVSPNYTITGVGAGNTGLTASATGYAIATWSEIGTTNYVMITSMPTSLAPNATGALSLALTAPAPTGGLTVNLLTSNSSAVTINPTTVTFAAGSTLSSAVLTGRGFGSAIISTQPTFGTFGGESKIFSGSTNSASLTSTISLAKGQTGITDTLTLTSAAPAGGLTFTLSSDVPQVATVPSTVTVAAGATTATFTVTGVGVGTANIKASFSGLADATTAVTVTGSIGLPVSLFSKRAASPITVLLSSTPALPVTVTITSDNPAVLMLSKDTSTAGTASITLTNVTTAPTFYGQGISAGNANLIITGTNFGSATVAQQVVDTTVAIYTTPTSTVTVGATPVNVTVGLVRIDSTTGLVFNSCAGCILNPGLTISIPVNSSNTGVGTISTNPVVLTGGGNASAVTTFVPVGPGTANVVVTEPAGFPTPNNTFLSAAINVNAPTFVPLYPSDTTGTGVYITKTATLSQFMSGGVPVTVTSNNPAIAVVSNSAISAGSGSIVFNGVTNVIPTVYVQGLSVGTTTLTYSSPGFTSVNTTVIVSPAGYVFTSAPTITLPSVSGPVNFQVALAIFNSAGNSVAAFCNNGSTVTCFANPQTSTQYTVTSSNPTVATVTSPNTIVTSTTQGTFQIQAVGTGTTTVALGPQPAPMTMISNTNYTQGLVTINTATTVANPSSTSAGLYVSATTSLGAAPRNAVTMTITSSNPAVAVLSNFSTVAGSASISIANVSTFANQTYYVQGLSAGTSTITVSAPGYSNSTSTITVTPTGIVLYNTTTVTANAFATTSNVTLYLAILNPSTLAVQAYCFATTCLPNPGTQFSVAVISSNPAAATPATSPVVFAVGATSAVASIVPHDIGVTTISLSNPSAGLSISTTANSQQYTLNVTGDTFTYSGSAIALGVGTNVPRTLTLPSTPGRPVTVTVSLADPTLGRLSTDVNTLGTGSTLTFPNTTGVLLPTIYIQGIAFGNTKLLISAPGYNSGFQPVVIYKTGMTLGSATNNHAELVTPNTTTVNMSFAISMLDPYSLSWVADCGVTNQCTPNPGQSTAVTLVTADPNVATFPTVPSTIDPAIGLGYATVTPVGTGFTDYSVGPQPAGFFATTTIAKRTGRIAVNNSLNMVSHDVDTGVGVEVVSNYGLSGTTVNILSIVTTATVADPTVAILSTSPTVAGSAQVSFSSINAINATFYVQGLKEGTTTITFVGDMYVSRTVTVRVHKSGFVTHQPDFAATFTNHSYNVPIVPAVLDDSLQWFQDAQINPSHTGSSVAVSTSNAAVGTITTSPVTFAASATTANANLHFVTTGTTNVLLGAPSSGFSTPVNYQSVNAIIQ